MDLRISSNQLSENIRKHGRAAADAWQVEKRLRRHLQDQLKEIYHEYRLKNTTAQAQRLSLIDPRYMEAMDRLVEVVSVSIHSRMQYEAYDRLFESRRSLRYLKV